MVGSPADYFKETVRCTQLSFTDVSETFSTAGNASVSKWKSIL